MTKLSQIVGKDLVEKIPFEVVDRITDGNVDKYMKEEFNKKREGFNTCIDTYNDVEVSLGEERAIGDLLHWLKKIELTDGQRRDIARNCWQIFKKLLVEGRLIRKK